MKEYINALKIAEYDIAYLSACGIQSKNVGQTNIMFSTNKRIKIIDTDFYKSIKNRKKLYDLRDSKILPSKYIEILLKYMKVDEFEDLTIDEMGEELKLLYKINL